MNFLYFMEGRLDIYHNGYGGLDNNGRMNNDIADFEVTGLTGTNTSRVIQLVTRINW